jgi:Ca2+-binding RTX toxin-like protein
MATYTHFNVVGSPAGYWGFLVPSASPSVTSTLVIFTHADGSETRYAGTGLSLSGGVWSGTITSASRTSAGGGSVYEQITGFSVDASAVLPFANDTNVNTNPLFNVLSGTDTLNGWSGDDDLRGFNGDDTLNGGEGFNNMRGGAGNDTLIGGTAASSTGGNRADYLDATGGVTINLKDGLNSSTSSATGAGVGTDTLVNIERVRGSNFGDVYVVASSFVGQYGTFNEFEGRGGNDVITGNGNTRISYAGALAGVTVNMAAQTAQGTAAGDAANVGVDTFTGVNGVRGSDFADVITAAGTGGEFIFEGRGGDDTLTGGSRGINNFDSSIARYTNATAGVTVTLGATSTVTGDASVGTDTLVNMETVQGSGFADSFTAQGGFQGQFGAFNLFEGRGGNDIITGNGQTRVSYANALAAVTVDLQAGTAASTAGGDAAGVGVDTITGGVNGVHGSDFNDTLLGRTDGTPELFRGDAGNDTIDGRGGGLNVADYRNSAAGVNVNLILGTAADGWGTSDTLLNMQGVRGSEFGDTITGDAGANYITGQNGDDVIYGGGGDDTIAGDDDGVFGGAFGGGGTQFDTGNDTLYGGDGNDTLLGGNGNDSLYGGTGGDALRGGGGFDYVRYDDAVAGVAVFIFQPSSNTGEAAGDSYDSVEGFVGSNFADTIIANEGANVLIGLNGSDVLFGAGGSDSLYGANGEDSLFGGAGGDYLDGGLGYDYARYDFALAGVTANLTMPSVNTGEAVGDIYVDIQGFTGTNFDDGFVGDGQANVHFGFGGNDTLVGYANIDALFGGDGADTLFGGTEQDFLFGEGGADTFVFLGTGEALSGIDSLQDFSSTVDKIALSASGFGVSAINFVTGADPTQATPQFIYNPGNNTLYFDPDGTGVGSTPVPILTVQNGGTIAAGDLVLI